MDGFEFFFTLFGLLLGFSLIEVISGFGRAIESKVLGVQVRGAARTHIGWLSPLLGLFVAFNLVSFWTAAWSLREVIPVQYLALLFGLVVTGGYYLAAILVFPPQIQRGADLDNHYFQVKRWVLAIVILANVLGASGVTIIGHGALPGPTDILLFALLIALLFARGHLANLLLLIPIAAAYPLTSLIFLLL